MDDHEIGHNNSEEFQLMISKDAPEKSYDEKSLSDKWKEKYFNE